MLYKKIIYLTISVLLFCNSYAQQQKTNTDISDIWNCYREIRDSENPRKTVRKLAENFLAKNDLLKFKILFSNYPQKSDEYFAKYLRKNSEKPFWHLHFLSKLHPQLRKSGFALGQIGQITVMGMRGQEHKSLNFDKIRFRAMSENIMKQVVDTVGSEYQLDAKFFLNDTTSHEKMKHILEYIIDNDEFDFFSQFENIVMFPRFYLSKLYIAYLMFHSMVAMQVIYSSCINIFGRR